jgi:hypothetical protein
MYIVYQLHNYFTRKIFEPIMQHDLIDNTVLNRIYKIS